MIQRTIKQEHNVRYIMNHNRIIGEYFTFFSDTVINVLYMNPKSKDSNNPVCNQFPPNNE